MSSSRAAKVAEAAKAKEEKQVVEDLRKAVRELPLAELTKMRNNGLNGQALYRALGFKSQQEEREWFAKGLKKSSRAEDSDDASNDEEDDYSNDDDDGEAPIPKKQGNHKKPVKMTGANNIKLGGTKSKSKLETVSSDSDNSESDDDDDGDDNNNDNGNSKSKSKKKSKKAPPERSSKIQVSRKREVVPVVAGALKSAKDPRFSKMQMDMSLHRARYGFLEELRDAEIEEKRKSMQRELLARQLKSSRRGRRLKKLTDEELAELRADLTRLEQHRAETNRAKTIQAKVSEFKHKQQGKKLSFIPHQQKKQIEREVKFEDFSKRNKLERYMKKRQRMEQIKTIREDSKGPKLGV